mgnify:CR=1 FL=1
MDSLVISLQVITALGIFNVWFIRSGAKTRWRGGEARNMKEEFGVYGLKPPVMIVAGGAKYCAPSASLLVSGSPLSLSPHQ